jgi:bifunctional ADP-heptose synthase (sugar kinase/adenylyltransferase)
MKVVMIVGHVAWVGEARTSCKILVAKLYENNSVKDQDGEGGMMIRCILKKYVLVF